MTDTGADAKQIVRPATLWASPEHSVWGPYSAGLRWRAYQEKALQSFERALAAGARSFHLVAPPGAGKTLLGLAMAERLAAPTVALSPNAAIQEQWLARLAQHWQCVDDTLAQFESRPPAADRVRDSVQCLTALTYQKIAVRGDNDGLHANVIQDSLELKRQGVRVIIADECHHINGWWGSAVQALVDALGSDVFVIGLTATPQIATTGPAARLLGAVDHEITLPSVVRSGDLAPFQDLCYLVAPSAEENDRLQACANRFARLYQRLGGEGGGQSETDNSSATRFSLALWADAMLLRPENDDGKAVADLMTLWEREPDLVAALCRRLHARSYKVPDDLPYMPEFQDEETLSDRLRLAAHHCAYALARGELDSELAHEARECLAPWGFEIGPGQVQEKQGELQRELGYSRQKLVGMGEILKREQYVMGDELSALVLTDFEFPAEAHVLSCLDVMDLLTTDPELDQLAPIMITGSSFLIDDDLWTRFEEVGRRYCETRDVKWTLEKTEERGYWRIHSEDAGWDTRQSVALATHMMALGISRCIIGTRALLGEGWDCPRLNTLVDLSVVSSGVSVNQMRGRTLRQDPNNGAKVANNWDVMCVSPLGDGVDLHRLQRKHAHLCGVTDDGQVERGLGHVHSYFEENDGRALFEGLPAFNEMMSTRAGDRGGAAKRWRIGERFDDQEYRVLHFAWRRRKSRAGVASDERAPPTEVRALVVARHASEASVRQKKELAAAVALGLVGVGLGFVVTPWLAPVALAAAWWVGRKSHRHIEALRPSSVDEDLRSLGRIIAGENTAVKVETRDDGSLSMFFPEAGPAQHETWTVQVAELLGPVVRQRYLIVEPMTDLQALHRKQGEDCRVFPVPRSLSSRKNAQALVDRWNNLRRSNARLLHTSSDEAQPYLQTHRGKRPLGGAEALRTLWR